MSDQESSLSHELSVAREAAAAATGVLLQGWGKRPEFRFKTSKTDLVTEFDKQAETVVIRSLSQAFPHDAIVGEEGGGQAGRSRRAWHVDPIDGTTNFAHGLPLFGTSIGLLVDDEPAVGVVTAPALGYCFHGGRGLGAFLNDQPIQVSDVAELARSLVVTGFPYIRTGQDDNLPEFAAFMHATQGVRRLGSAALDLCFVACGWLDAYWERNIKSWDLVAGAAILLAAGGQVGDPGGGRFVAGTGSILASNGKLHQPMLDILLRFARPSPGK
jgi:myo-inositol-1(or 4)-monophosphatase